MTAYKSNISAEGLRREIKGRLNEAARVAGQAAAKEIAEEVKKRIPARGGWYSIYRDAIEYEEDGSSLRWRVDGLAKINYSSIPADTTLIEFKGEDAAGAVLKDYNPWTLDLIPPIVGGYGDSIVTQMAGEGGTDTERERLLPLLDIIKAALSEKGAILGDDSTLLIIKGAIYADIAFLARRLELGYSGFPHIPHWSIAIAKAGSDMGKWLSQGGVAAEINKIISGG